VHAFALHVYVLYLVFWPIFTWFLCIIERNISRGCKAIWGV